MSTRCCAVHVTIYSNCSIIPPSFKFTQLHALTLAAHAYALLLTMICFHYLFPWWSYHGSSSCMAGILWISCDQLKIKLQLHVLDQLSSAEFRGHLDLLTGSQKGLWILIWLQMLQHGTVTFNLGHPKIGPLPKQILLGPLWKICSHCT